jgi:hypothetical protein
MMFCDQCAEYKQEAQSSASALQALIQLIRNASSEASIGDTPAISATGAASLLASLKQDAHLACSSTPKFASLQVPPSRNLKVVPFPGPVIGRCSNTGCHNAAKVVAVTDKDGDLMNVFCDRCVAGSV